MYKNQFDKNGTCAKTGNNAEQQFKLLATQKGYIAKEATKQENILKHFDFRLIKGDEITRVEVKAMKRISRYDNNFNSDVLWIELKNVNGNTGWLYGESDFIAFQYFDDFWLVFTKVLRHRVAFLTKNAKTVDTASQALYNHYTRQGRQDVITLIKYSDITDIKLRNNEW